MTNLPIYFVAGYLSGLLGPPGPPPGGGHPGPPNIPGGPPQRHPGIHGYPPGKDGGLGVGGKKEAEAKKVDDKS